MYINEIKKDFNSLIEKNVDYRITHNLIHYNELYSEDQLKYMLSQPSGIEIKENIILYYVEGLGYNCSDYSNYTKKDPLCVAIERFLNKKKNIDVI